MTVLNVGSFSARKADNDIIVFKGMVTDTDSLSAFRAEKDPTLMTVLDEYLWTKGVTEIFVVGFATDLGVENTANDGALLGYKSYVIDYATCALMRKTTILESEDELAAALDLPVTEGKAGERGAE